MNLNKSHYQARLSSNVNSTAAKCDIRTRKSEKNRTFADLPPFVTSAFLAISHFFFVSAQTGAFSFFGWDRNFDYFIVNTYTYTNSRTTVLRQNQIRYDLITTLDANYLKKSHVIEILLLSITTKIREAVYWRINVTATADN